MPRRKKAEIEAEKKRLEEEASQTGTEGNADEGTADEAGTQEGTASQTGDGAAPDEGIPVTPQAGKELPDAAGEEKNSGLEESTPDSPDGDAMGDGDGTMPVEESSTGDMDSEDEGRSDRTGDDQPEDAVGWSLFPENAPDGQTDLESGDTEADQMADTSGEADSQEKESQSGTDSSGQDNLSISEDHEGKGPRETDPVWENGAKIDEDHADNPQTGTGLHTEARPSDPADVMGSTAGKEQDRYGSDSPSQEGPAGRAPARRRRRSPSIVAIDGQLVAETDASKARNDLLDLTESLKTGRILTGTMQGVEQPAGSRDHSLAVIYHGDYKVIIPSEEMVELPEDARDRSEEELYRYLLNKRLGAEVDYIVRGIDEAEGIAVASRLDAMRAKRKAYYSGTDRNGQHPIRPGICAEARVVSVIRAGAFVDLFGLETYIPLRELSYQRWMDAAGHFQTGQRILVRVLSVEGSEREGYRVTASVKQAGENPYEKALRRYSVGNRYVGTVSMVDTTGVFVALDGGIDCLCSYPRRGRPPRGARATVRILGINEESNRIWGAITHIAAPH